MKRICKFISLFLVFALTFSLAACGPDAEAKEHCDVATMDAILKQVTFADKMERQSDLSASLCYFGLPEGATVVQFLSLNNKADELTLITLSGEDQMSAAKEIVSAYLTSKKAEAQRYDPVEAKKYDSAKVWSDGVYLGVCITDDMASVNEIVKSGPSHTLPNGGANNQFGTFQTSSGNTGNNENSGNTGENGNAGENGNTGEGGNTEEGGNSGESNNTSYPDVTNPADTYTIGGEFGDMMKIGESAFEIYGYSETTSNQYVALLNKVATALSGKTQVYSLPIPTAMGIVFPDNVTYPGWRNQGDDIATIISKYNSNIIGINCYSKMMEHRDEYLYFRTDHHWNGIGAYYAYETFCQAKGLTPYTMEQREEVIVENFKGTLYDDFTGLKVDTIYAYKPYCSQATMKFYANMNNVQNGISQNWPIISGNQAYTLFAGADQPLAIFTNPQVTDGSVAVIVKESFGNALLPYLVDHYSTIYEIDYRHWTGDLVSFVNEVNADDLIFANNTGMISTNTMVAKLSNIIK